MAQKYLELSAEDLVKVNQSRAQNDSLKIDSEQLFIAEFGKHYGWGGVNAILNNEIDAQTASWLLIGARKIDSRTFCNDAQVVLIGTGAAKSKRPSQVFKKATAEHARNMKADL